MSKREINLYISDILESISAIEGYLVGIDFSIFSSDRKTYSATIRELEIIGEASAQLPDNFKNSYTEVPWRLMKDFRNVLSHHYFGVNYEIVWDVIQNQLPAIKKKISLISCSS